MTLVRVWRGQVLGMVGAAAAVPVALVGSLAVLALAGGFGGLSALGQAFSGPSVPVSQPAAARAGAAARPVPAALAAALTAPAATTSAGAASAPSGQSSTSSPPASSNGGSTSTPSQGGSEPGSGPQPHHSSGPGPASGGQTQPGPESQPTAADKVVAAGTSVTSQVPGPAGPAATKALQTAGSTLDSIAPIKTP